MRRLYAPTRKTTRARRWVENGDSIAELAYLLKSIKHEIDQKRGRVEGPDASTFTGANVLQELLIHRGQSLCSESTEIDVEEAELHRPGWIRLRAVFHHQPNQIDMAGIDLGARPLV